MRNKLEEEKKKEKLSISVSRELMKVVDENQKNRSKYIEWLIYQDLTKNNLIDSSVMF
jgi:hypothetical protein